MNIDFSKRLCEATLGEFIAAERSIAVLVAWTMGITGAGFLALGRYFFMRWKSKRTGQLIDEYMNEQHPPSTGK